MFKLKDTYVGQKIEIRKQNKILQLMFSKSNILVRIGRQMIRIDYSEE